jgi:hypothetical protein
MCTQKVNSKFHVLVRHQNHNSASFSFLEGPRNTQFPQVHCCRLLPVVVSVISSSKFLPASSVGGEVPPPPPLLLLLLLLLLQMIMMPSRA